MAKSKNCNICLTIPIKWPKPRNNDSAHLYGILMVSTLILSWYLEDPASLIMVLSIMVNGIKMDFVKEEEHKSGKMVVCTLGTGKMTKPTARVD